MRKIAIIACWFGPLPNYFDLWLASARANKTIDFYIFTDQTGLESGENISVTHCCLKDIKTRAERALRMHCCLEAPYKLCDYRVAYGIMFADVLKPYDFWGFCDMDVVFGDLRAFLTDALLDRYEKISNLGHLMLFRNTDRVNRIFMDCKNDMYNTYYEAFHMKSNCAFDEKGGLTGLADAGYYKTYKDYSYTADIFPDTYHFRTFFNYHTDDLHLYEYDTGKLYAHVLKNGTVEKTEMMYIHLQARKMDKQTQDTERYLILPGSFAEYRPVNREMILEENDEGKYTGPLPMTKARKNPPIPLWIRVMRKARRTMYRGTCFRK